MDDKISKGDIKLNDEIEMRLTDNEKISHSNVWCTHQETTESLKKSGVKFTPYYWASAPKCWLTR